MDQSTHKRLTKISRTLGSSSQKVTIQKGFVDELLNAQDTVLCSYFAQRSGGQGEGHSRKSTVEEAFQGLDSVPKGRQRDEGGEEARVMTCVSGQDPSDGGKTGGNAQSRIFEHPEDAERIR